MRLWGQLLDRRHSLQMLLQQLCSQMCDPPRLFCHTCDPPAILVVALAAVMLQCTFPQRVLFEKEPLMLVECCLARMNNWFDEQVSSEGTEGTGP
jgi:hypothetical protein